MTDDAFAHISAAFEKKSPIDIDGTRYGIWVTDVRSPRAPGSLHSTVFLIAKSPTGTACNGELHVGEDTLRDTEYMVECAVNAMRDIVTGKLPPGTRSLL